MNFDYSDEQRALMDQARRLLSRAGGPAMARRVIEEKRPFDESLWQRVAGLGWLGAALPERHGGQELGYTTLCAIAEEFGRVLAPVPLCTSMFLAAEAILRWGTPSQQSHWLPRLAAGECVGTLALVEDLGSLADSAVRATVRRERLRGTKLVVDGLVAGLGVVAARDDAGSLRLYLLDPRAREVRRELLDSIDPSRPWARLTIEGALVEPLGDAVGWSAVEELMARAAILCAFLQIGGADACLGLARDYALDRWTFGRPIGQYQAVKHRLVDMFTANELARSNAYAAVCVLERNADGLPLAAATARVSANEAFERAARDYMQTLGGVAATWAHDAHLYYRRARHLAGLLGGSGEWRERVASELERTGTG